MSNKTYLPPKTLTNPYLKDMDEYSQMYKESIENPESFFGHQAKENLDWIEPFRSTHNNNFIRWIVSHIFKLNKSALLNLHITQLLS